MSKYTVQAIDTLLAETGASTAQRQDQTSNKYPGQLQITDDVGTPKNAIMTHMLSTTDQLWLLQHAKGRLPSIETQAIENDIHKRIHQFWAANRLKPLLSKEWNTIGPIENIDIENSIFNDPLMTSEHLLFQNDTLTKQHLIFVLDASLSKIR